MHSLEVITAAHKWQPLLNHLAASYPGPVYRHDVYEGKGRLLLMWGPGSKANWRAFKAHRRQNKPVVALDMGYWQREVEDGRNRHFRFTINELHPYQLEPSPPDRFQRLGVEVTQPQNDPDGPIILIGMGVKSRSQLGYRGVKWETETVAAIRAAFPGVPIIYRPKRDRREILAVDRVMANIPIQHVIRGASLVVCRHSNVAVNCVTQGVPAVCIDGAGKHIWPAELDAEHAVPMRDARIDFCNALAYWQYSFNEMRTGTPWPWILRQINEY